MSSPGALPPITDWRGQAAVHRYFICDVFTAEPLAGNQLAVFVDGRPFSSADMQRIALEMNLAETVFVLPPQGEGDVAIRIFTPRVELPFAGHPALGTAFVVAEAAGSDQVRLETAAGLVPISFDRTADGYAFGRMTQPVPEWHPYDQAGALLDALHVDSSRLPIEVYLNGPRHVLVNLESEEAVGSLQPDLAALSELGIAANCFAGQGRVWTTRMFWPAAGIPEDAATGSAAGPLAIHLARHGMISFGEEIEIRQGAYMGRPSRLHATAFGTPDRIESVEVGGSAVIVAEGLLRTARS
jgi:trans-2,3-dihydro-3-hydroxyanthranilate isomerase